MSSSNTFDEPDLTDGLIFIYIVDPIITALLREQQALENSDNSLNDDENDLIDTSDIYEDTVSEATDECEEELVLSVTKAKLSPKATTKPDFELRCEGRDFGADSGVEMELEIEEVVGANEAELEDEGVQMVLPEAEGFDAERLVLVGPAGIIELEVENGAVEGGMKEAENVGDYGYDGDCESQGEKKDEHRSKRCKKG